ncbi:hypothetical protein [Variovorax sp. OV700]|uniref:hypothetical protein n=1 Tax=Variovorax sp. OV700 TaxID=1882826 RepID=UPI001C3134C9|nr:hypothetical protein [Variovorax sp. OV700]
MEFTLNSPVQRTLLFDSGSALVEAREKKAAQGNRLDADRCRFYLASRSKPRGYARQSSFTDEAPRCATAYSRYRGCSRHSPGQHGQQYLLMTTKQELPDETLSATAIAWRRKPLEGDLHARGIAHELETELRRRAGAPFTNYDTFYMRPLETRTARLRGWRFWRGR